MNEGISNISSVVAADDIYCQSYSDYMKSGINKLKDKIHILSQVIDDPTLTTVESEFGFNLNTVLPFGSDDYLKIEDIRSALENDLDVVDTLRGNTVRIDDIVNDINEQVNLSELLSQALNSAQIVSTDASAIVSNFTAKISGILNNATGNLKLMADKYVDIMASDLNCREKIQAISQLNGLDVAQNTSTDDEFITSLSNSEANQFTGVNPVAGIAAGIADFLTYEYDLSSVKAAVVSIGRGIASNFQKAMNYIATNGRKDILNATRKVLEYTGASNQDFYSVSGGDGTVDNCFMAGYAGDYAIKRFSVNVNIGGINRDGNALAAMLKTRLNKNEWVAMDIPGARVYFAKVDKKGSWDTDYGLEVRIKFRPIDYETVLYDSDIQSIDNFVDYYAAVSQASAAFTPSQEENVALEDDYFFKVCGVGKALAYNFAGDVLSNNIGKTFTEAGTTNSAERLKLIALSQGNHADDASYINPTPSGHTVVIGPTTFSDPTNLDFAQRLSVCEDNCPTYLDVTAAGYDGVFSTSVMTRIALAAASLYLSSQDEYDGLYVPYIKTNSISKGSYHINSDKQNYSKVFIRAATILTVAAVVGVTVAGLKISKKLKVNAVNANLKASIIQDSVKQKIINGETISKAELKDMYKKTKKAVRLNKLTGGFASITTGLSTWTEGSIPSLGGSTAVQIQDVERLLHSV